MRVAKRNGTRDNLEERQDRLTPLVEQLLAEAYQLSLTPRQVQSLVAKIIKEREAR